MLSGASTRWNHSRFANIATSDVVINITCVPTLRAFGSDPLSTTSFVRLTRSSTTSSPRLDEPPEARYELRDSEAEYDRDQDGQVTERVHPEMMISRLPRAAASRDVHQLLCAVIANDLNAAHEPVGLLDGPHLSGVVRAVIA